MDVDSQASSHGKQKTLQGPLQRSRGPTTCTSHSPIAQTGIVACRGELSIQATFPPDNPRDRQIITQRPALFLHMLLSALQALAASLQDPQP